MPNTMRKIEFYGPKYITVEPSVCKAPVSEDIKSKNNNKKKSASKIQLFTDNTLYCSAFPGLATCLAAL